MLTKIYTLLPDDSLKKQKNQFLFLDIETTGFKKDNTILYLIGCGYYKEDSFQIIQWFNDDGISEPEMLSALKNQISTFMEQTAGTGKIFSFNGEGFDIPYLNRHYELNDIPFQINVASSLDLYKILKPFQALYRLEHGRQKDWEIFLNKKREDLYDGGQLIPLYKEYLLKKKSKLLDLLLLHNKEDIQGMAELSPLLAYQQLLKGKITYMDMAYSQKNIHSVREV